MMQKNPQLHVRVPSGLKAEIERLATANRRTVNSEIVFGLEFYAQHTEQKKAPGSRQANPDASHAE